MHGGRYRHCLSVMDRLDQGFQYGSAILQFDATGDEPVPELGRTATLDRMTPMSLISACMTTASRSPEHMGAGVS